MLGTLIPGCSSDRPKLGMLLARNLLPRERIKGMPRRKGCSSICTGAGVGTATWVNNQKHRRGQPPVYRGGILIPAQTCWLCWLLLACWLLAACCCSPDDGAFFLFLFL